MGRQLGPYFAQTCKYLYWSQKGANMVSKKLQKVAMAVGLVLMFGWLSIGNAQVQANGKCLLILKGNWRSETMRVDLERRGFVVASAESAAETYANTYTASLKVYSDFKRAIGDSTKGAIYVDDNSTGSMVARIDEPSIYGSYDNISIQKMTRRAEKAELPTCDELKGLSRKLAKSGGKLPTDEKSCLIQVKLHEDGNRLFGGWWSEDFQKNLWRQGFSDSLKGDKFASSGQGSPPTGNYTNTYTVNIDTNSDESSTGRVLIVDNSNGKVVFRLRKELAAADTDTDIFRQAASQGFPSCDELKEQSRKLSKGNSQVSTEWPIWNVSPSTKTLLESTAF